MKSFLIIGMGRFGSALAKELWRLGNEVVVVDREKEQINRVADFATHAMAADISDEHVLQSIGARNFDHVVIAFSGNIEDNILLTVMLQNLGVKSLIVKARGPLHVKVLDKLGVQRIVLPEHEMGTRLAQVLSANKLVDYLEIAEGVDIAEIHVPQRWVGKSIRQLNVRHKYGLHILVIKNPVGNRLLPSPHPDYVLQEGDILIVMGSDRDIDMTDRL